MSTTVVEQFDGLMEVDAIFETQVATFDPLSGGQWILKDYHDRLWRVTLAPYEPEPEEHMHAKEEAMFDPTRDEDIGAAVKALQDAVQAFAPGVGLVLTFFDKNDPSNVNHATLATFKETGMAVMSLNTRLQAKLDAYLSQVAADDPANAPQRAFGPLWHLAPPETPAP